MAIQERTDYSIIDESDNFTKSVYQDAFVKEFNNENLTPRQVEQAENHVNQVMAEIMQPIYPEKKSFYFDCALQELTMFSSIMQNNALSEEQKIYAFMLIKCLILKTVADLKLNTAINAINDLAQKEGHTSVCFSHTYSSIPLAMRYKQKAGISQESCDEVKQWKYDGNGNADSSVSI